MTYKESYTYDMPNENTDSDQCVELIDAKAMTGNSVHNVQNEYLGDIREINEHIRLSKAGRICSGRRRVTRQAGLID